MKKADIPVDYLRERFTLDEVTGDLYWKARPLSHFCRSGDFNTKCVGKKAGRLNSVGYFHVTLHWQNREFKVTNHRIVWALVTGAWPKQVIDHINRNRLDNRPENLRDVSQAENARNRGPSKGSPPKGAANGVRARGANFYAYGYHVVDGRKKQCHLGAFTSLESAKSAVSAFQIAKSGSTS